MPIRIGFRFDRSVTEMVKVGRAVFTFVGYTLVGYFLVRFLFANDQPSNETDDPGHKSRFDEEKCTTNSSVLNGWTRFSCVFHPLATDLILLKYEDQ